MSNRNKKLIGKRIDQLPPEELSLIVDESLKQKLKQAKDGKYLDNFTARDVQNGKNVVVFTQIMKSTSWIFSIEFSEDEIYFPVRYFRSGICGVIIVTVIALLLAALLLTYRMSVPLRKITQFAE